MLRPRSAAVAPQHLLLDESVVESMEVHQLVMVALLRHNAVVQHYNGIGTLHRAQAMSDHQDCVVPHHGIQSLLDLTIGKYYRYVCLAIMTETFALAALGSKTKVFSSLV